jgi:sugar-specific transcriptional regulator TrmB
MQADLVNKLTSFGFTINQAKVYLCIVQSGITQVGKISKITQLHRQDIYKLLPKLERMGLITRTIEKPFTIEAIPICCALESIIEKEKEKSNQKISQLENSLKEVSDEIQKEPNIKEEPRFTLLTTDIAIKNKIQLIFEKKHLEFKIVTNLEKITNPSLNYFRNFLKSIADNKAKSKLVIVNPGNRNCADQIINKIAPTEGEFTAKLIRKCTCKNYQIIDDNEVWIVTQQETETGYPCILWTNDQNIVETYLENFNKTWNNPKISLLHDSNAYRETDSQRDARALVKII